MNSNKFYNDYIKNIKSQGLSFNYNFLKRKFNRGRLGFYKDGCIFKLSNTQFDRFIEMLSICNEMFPNRWDLNFKIFTGDKKRTILCIENLIIHFPKTTIKNSKNFEHTITNLFIQLTLKFTTDTKEKLFVKDVKGFRTTYTHKEVISSYCHSHLLVKTACLLNDINTPSNILEPQPFCLGFGGINYVLSDIENKDYDQNRFVNLFLNIITLSKWESLEGKPYRFMQEIKAKKSNYVSRFYSDDESIKRSVVAISNYWKNNIESLEMSINIDGTSNVKVINIGNFLDVPDEILGVYKKYLFAAERDGYFYTLGSESSFKKICDLSQVPPYIFRGKSFPIEVIEKLADDDKEENIVVPEIVKEKICELLTIKIKDELFKRSIQTGENITYYK